MAVGHPVDLTGIAGPVAQLHLRVVGERADDGDALGAVGRGRFERQRAVVLQQRHAVVLQQRHGFAGHLQVEPLVFIGTDDGLDAFGVGQARILEQAEAELER